MAVAEMLVLAETKIHSIFKLKAKRDNNLSLFLFQTPTSLTLKKNKG